LGAARGVSGRLRRARARAYHGAQFPRTGRADGWACRQIGTRAAWHVALSVRRRRHLPKKRAGQCCFGGCKRGLGGTFADVAAALEQARAPHIFFSERAELAGRHPAMPVRSRPRVPPCRYVGGCACRHGCRRAAARVTISARGRGSLPKKREGQCCFGRLQEGFAPDCELLRARARGTRGEGAREAGGAELRGHGRGDRIRRTESAGPNPPAFAPARLR
jgi:hypothetical protein